MCEVVEIHANKLFSLVLELIHNGQNAKIAVRGTSMLPFLRNDIDSVELSKARFDDIKRGDIVMIRRYDGAYVMHRVIQKSTKEFFIIGDAQQWIEGPLHPDQLVAVVNTVWRKKKKISCSNIVWKTLCNCWLLVIPWRYRILKANEKLHKWIE